MPATAAALLCLCLVVPAGAGDWRVLEPGLELGTFVSPTPSPIGDCTITVLRVDPARFDLVLAMGSELADDGSANRTAREWVTDADLLAAINASMFQTDYRTSTELMFSADHVNNARLGGNKAVLAFDLAPEAPADLPRVRIIDRACEDLDALRPHYRVMVQSIRMVSCQRSNTWQQSDRRWSHAVIGIDGQGRPLLIHARSPWTTHDFIDILLALPIDLQQLQYAEGGPEAQLFVRAGGLELELVGSFETGFFESDDNVSAWPVPNVVGVQRRSGVAPPDGWQPEPVPADLSTREPAHVGQVILDHRRQLQFCYEQALREDPQLSGAGSVRFVIEADGSVSDVTLQGDFRDDLAACVRGVVTGMRFRRDPGGGRTVIEYPLLSGHPTH